MNHKAYLYKIKSVMVIQRSMLRHASTSSACTLLGTSMRKSNN